MLPGDSMKAEDVARYLHLGKNTVYQLAKTGQLASYHVGRKLRFAFEDVEAYLEASRQPAIGEASAPVAGTTASPESFARARERQEDPGLLAAASFGNVGADPIRLAGNDVVADVLTSALNFSGTASTCLNRESYTALVNLYAGEVDAAVVNLYDHRSNSYNIPYVLGLAPGLSVEVMRICSRKAGLIVADRNPKRLTTWGSLLHEGVRLANRTKGSGARVLLDEKLRAMEARSESIEGYAGRPASGARAVERVASGLADVTVGTQREADRVRGVQLVPLQDEWVDIVVAKNPRTRAFVRALSDLAGGGDFKRSLAALPGCDSSRLGVVVFEN